VLLTERFFIIGDFMRKDENTYVQIGERVIDKKPLGR